MWFLLPAFVYLLKDVMRIASATSAYGKEIAEREGVTVKEGAEKAVKAAGGAVELTRIYEAERAAEKAAADQKKAFDTLSALKGRDPAAGVDAAPAELPMIGGGPASYLPAAAVEVTRTETPDVFLPALVVLGLWFWSKQGR